jgi:hypothetical protein
MLFTCKLDVFLLLLTNKLVVKMAFTYFDNRLASHDCRDLKLPALLALLSNKQERKVLEEKEKIHLDSFISLVGAERVRWVFSLI